MGEEGPVTTDMQKLMREVEGGGTESSGAHSASSGADDVSQDDGNGGAVSPVYRISVILDEGESLAREGNNKEALAAFNRAIALEPTSHMAWFNRGVLLESDGDVLGARQSFAIALDIDANNGPAAANLAILLDRIEEAQEAGKWAHVALRTYPGHAMLMEVANRSGVSAEILEPVNPEPEVAVAESVDVEIEAVEVAPKPAIKSIDINTLVADATELLRAGNPEVCLGLLEAHLHGAASSHNEAWRIAAGAMARMNRVDEAIATFNGALEIDNTDSKSWFNLGSLHRRGDRNDLAKTCFHTALGLDPNYTRAAVSLRETAMDVGDIELAIKAWDILLGLEPEHDSATTYAELLVGIASGEAAALENIDSLPPTLPEGPELALKALNHIPAGDVYASLRASAYSLAGKHVEAVGEWKGLLKSDPTNADNWMGLSKSLAAAGDLDTSVKCREKAIALGGDGVISSANEALATYPLDSEGVVPAKTPEVQMVPLPTHDDSDVELVDEAEDSTVGEDSTPVEEVIPEETEASTVVESSTPEEDIIANVPEVAELTAELLSPDDDWSTEFEEEFEEESEGESEEEPEVEVLEVEVPEVEESEAKVGAETESLEDMAALSSEPEVLAPHVEATIVEPEQPEVDDEVLFAPIEAQPRLLETEDMDDTGIDLATAALDAASRVSSHVELSSSAAGVSNEIEWYNKGLSLITDRKYRQSLSCFDRALPAFKDDDEMVIRILNARGNAYYYLEDYPKTIENYHQAMLINPAAVSGRTLYNMGTAYAEMERYDDAIKCYEQAMPRNLEAEEQSLAKEQIRRCTQLKKEKARLAKKT